MCQKRTWKQIQLAALSGHLIDLQRTSASRISAINCGVENDRFWLSADISDVPVTGAPHRI